MGKRKLIFDEEGLRKFAKALKATRKRLGYTQESLAYKSDLTLSQIARIETVKTNPTISTIFTLCHAMEIEPSELFKEMSLIM